MNKSTIIEKIFGRIDTQNSGLIIKDLSFNFEKYLNNENLSEKELALLFIALSKTLCFKELEYVSLEFAKHLEIQDEIIEEAKQIPAMNGMLNTYHKFRHFIDTNDNKSSNEYGNMDLKSWILFKTTMEQSIFEIIFVTISALNSCEKCVVSHEKHAIEIGASRQKIHDAVRLAAIIKGLSEIFK